MHNEEDYAPILSFLKRGKELDVDNTFTDEYNKFDYNIGKLRDVLLDDDNKESIRQILLGLFDIESEQQEQVIEIYLEAVTKGKIAISDSKYSDYINQHKIDLKQIYDVRTGILDIVFEDENSSNERCYIAPTYLGYKILDTICKNLNIIYKEFEERSPIGCFLISDYSSGKAKFLLVYPEILGCYTFPGWYFRTGKPENYKELIDRLVNIIFHGSLGLRLDPKIDCILPNQLDSMKKAYLYEIKFPLDIQKLIRRSSRLLDLSLARCRNFCYASIDEMLKPDWSPYPEEHVLCGNKVKVFAMLRKLQTDFTNNRNESPDIIYENLKERIDSFKNLSLKVKHLKKVLDHQNNYSEITPYVKRYFEEDYR